MQIPRDRKGRAMNKYLILQRPHHTDQEEKQAQKSTPASADAVVKYQANQANNSVADSGIPGGNPFSHLFCLVANEEKREQSAGTSTAPANNPKMTYPPDLQNALEPHIHTKHRT
eukprot:1004035-Pelagomonas_calceolata.AAC.1